MKLTRSLLALALAATALPLVVGSPAAAAAGSTSGELDYDDQAGGSIGDYDLGYTVTVSNTTPAVGEDITVSIAWDEAAGVDPWGYSDLNLCWDAPPGWAAAGGAPTTQDYTVTTTQDTPTAGQVVGTDAPGVPAASSGFGDSDATGERTDVTSYETPAGRVYRFCAHTDRIDGKLDPFGVLDAVDSIHGTMTVTLEAPRSGPVSFSGLLATAAYTGDPSFHGGVPRRHPSPLAGGFGLPEDPAYEALSQPKSPGSLSQTTGGSMGNVSYDFDGDGGDTPGAPVTVTPSGTLLDYSLHTPAAHGLATVDPDGSWNYLPAGGYVGADSFQVRISDGDSSAVSTVAVQVLPGTAAMTVTKSAEEPSVLVGEPIHYSIEVASTGSLPLHDVVVEDPNAPDCDTTIDLVPQQQSEVVTCTYTPTAGDVGTYTNTATATTEDLDEPVMSNAVGVEVVAAASPRLEIQKATTQALVEAGGTITYEIEVTNTGGVPLTGVAVTDANAPDCERAVGGLAVGARSVWSCSLTATAAMVGDRTNIATADSNETDPVDSGPVVVEVTPGDGGADVGYTCTGVPVEGTVTTQIEVVGEDDVDPAEPGQPVAWTFRVANPSLGEVPLAITVDWLEVEYDRPANLDAVALSLLHPPGGTANPPPAQATPTVTASKVRFRTPATGDITIQTNGTMTYNGQPVTLPQIRITGQPTTAARGATIAWRAPRVVVRGSAPLVGSFTVNCTPTSTTVVSTHVNPELAILDVDKTSVQQAAMPGQAVEYDVLVRNRGNVALTGVAVDDPVAPDCDAAIGTLAAGAERLVECSRLITEGDVGRLRNVATATSDQTGPVSSNPADVVVGSAAQPGLEVDLVADTASVPAGTPAGWTVTARNTGNTPLTGLSLVADGASDCESAWSATEVDLGGSVAVACETPTAGLLTAFARGGLVSNQATVTSTETGPVASGAVEVSVTLPPTGWADVQPWYAEAADWLDHWDLASGFQDGTRYRGQNAITRAEVLRMVYRLAGTPEAPDPATHSFTDVPRWIADAVGWAAQDPDGDGPQEPLMTGMTSTRFGPDEAITRAQAVRLLFRFAETLTPQTVPAPPTHAFGDVPAWVADAVAWAAADADGEGPLEPLVTGLTPTRFGPDEDITRAQVARILFRLADLLDL